MIRAFNGKTPRIAESAFVSESAYVVGDVEIGENSGVWPGAVIRGDFGPIKIGKNTQIEDNSVLHAIAPLEIGNNVLIGHGAVIHGRRIGNDVLVGNNATVLEYVEIGNHCIIGANSMVTMGKKIPSNSFVVGVPAKIKRELSSDSKAGIYARILERHAELSEGKMPSQSYSDLAKQYKHEGL